MPTILDLGVAFAMSPIATLSVLNAQKDFTRNLLNAFEISSSDTRIGFMKYGRDAKLVSSLNASPMSLSNVNKAISGVTSVDPGHNILALLKLARKTFFQQNFGSRPGIAKSLLIFNDGRSGVSIDDLQSEAEKLREMGVKIVVLAFSTRVDEPELKQISSSRNSYFFADDNVAEFQPRIVPITSQLQPGNFHPSLPHSVHISVHIYWGINLILFHKVVFK